MSRRKHDDQLGFGSDSFLDIIANIVGILIILIVVAGVRVSRAPVATQSNDEQETLPASIPLTEAAVPDAIAWEPEPVSPIAEEPLPMPPSPVFLEPPKPAEPLKPSPQLVRRVSKLNESVERLKGVGTLRRQQVQQAVLQAGALKRRRSELTASIATQSASLDSLETESKSVKSTTETLNRQLSDLQVAIKNAEANGPKVETLRHLVTPMARTVQGEELHFHLAADKVTVVPLDEMLTVLKGRIDRQKRWLAKFNTHRGVIGPMNGFKMHYVVSRMQASVVDDLKYGGAMIRIGLREWRLEPDNELPAETFAAAVRPDGVFRRTLETASKDTTLTFWVYPDAFTLFRQLQTYGRERGFTVAGRPLPVGIEIAASPEGSRSAGQ